MIKISDNINIPAKELREEFFYSSGPGGQNVNKVATAVRLRFNIRQSTALPPAVKQRVMQAASSFITESGEIIIEAQRHRSQLKNREDAARRLGALIRQGLVKPRRRIRTTPTKASIKRRLDKKKQRGALKKLRSRNVVTDGNI